MSKYTISKYFLYFILYSIIGWCYEVFLETVVYRWGFSNRGVLFGPYCPVYGVGALVFVFTLYRLLGNKHLMQKLMYIPIIFLGCMLIATGIELAASYICEFFMGYWPWQTYVDYTYNFQGRIALSPSIRFGIGGVVFLYVLQPLFEKFSKKTGDENVLKIAIFAGVVFVVDALYTFGGLIQ